MNTETAESTATETKIYKVPSDNLTALTERFVKLGRRAKKLGLPAPTFTELKTERIERKDELTGVVRIILLHHIVVDPGCVEIKVNGWTFVATIQHTDEGNIVRRVGTAAELPAQYRNVTRLCEHCNTDRNRKDTYILRHEDGRYKQVGRNCLADFFGHDALMYAERAQYLCDLADGCEADEFGFGGSRGPNYEALEIYLGFVAECITRSGWMSRGKARELGCSGAATATVAYTHLHPPKPPTSFEPMFRNPSPESMKLGEEAIAWAAAIEGEDVAEYLHNIRIIARRGVYGDRDSGLAASIVAAYQRHLTGIRMRELQARRAEFAKHVGEVGKRIRVKLFVEKVVQCDGNYGTSYLHIMGDAEGNVFTWFASSKPLATATEVVVDGTIKRHGDYKGVKQNIMTRCSEVELKKYIAIQGDVIHMIVDVASEKEAQKVLRDRLGVKRLPTGLRWSEDIAQEVSEERVAV